MKRIVAIIGFILIYIFTFSCKRCPPSSVDPRDISFFFSLTDKDRNDLFFGGDSIYDPYSVKIAVGQNGEFRQIDISENKQCFYLGGFYPKKEPYIFYIEFVPNKIDTIKIESRITGRYEKPKGCYHFDIYEDDIFFNNVLICKNCNSSEVYKIEIQ